MQMDGASLHCAQPPPLSLLPCSSKYKYFFCCHLYIELSTEDKTNLYTRYNPYKRDVKIKK